MSLDAASSTDGPPADPEADPEAEPASPCIKVCTLDSARQMCTGCFRRLAEIGAWGRMTADKKRRVLAELPVRANSYRSGKTQ